MIIYDIVEILDILDLRVRKHFWKGPQETSENGPWYSSRSPDDQFSPCLLLQSREYPKELIIKLSRSGLLQSSCQCWSYRLVLNRLFDYIIIRVVQWLETGRTVYIYPCCGKGMELQWRHMDIMATQITDNATVCSSFLSSYNILTYPCPYPKVGLGNLHK